MIEIKKIAVIGGGNIRTQFACTCAAKGYEVNIHTSTTELYDGKLTIEETYLKSGCAARRTKASSISTLQFNYATGYLGCKYAFALLSLHKTCTAYVLVEDRRRKKCYAL